MPVATYSPGNLAMKTLLEKQKSDSPQADRG